MAVSDHNGVYLGDLKLRVEYYGGKRPGLLAKESVTNYNSDPYLNSHYKSSSTNRNIGRSELGYDFSQSQYKDLNPIQSQGSKLNCNQNRKKLQTIAEVLGNDSLNVEHTSNWKAQQFFRNKACSLEFTLPVQMQQSLIDAQNSIVEKKDDINIFSTMFSRQIQGSELIHMSKNHSMLIEDFDNASIKVMTGMGNLYKSSIQCLLIANNHMSENIKVNRPITGLTNTIRRHQ